tara:strand:+ start:1215 stop:2495 length:1281 start_codon:yes stop_codon:yes gene_type:complete
MTLLAQLEQQVRDYLSNGENEKVAFLCEQILAIDPDHSGALDILASRALKLKKFDAAEQYLKILTRLFPEHTVYLTKLGYVQEQQGKLQTALSTYLECHKRNPKNLTIYLYLGYLYILLGNETKAAEVFSLGEDIDGRILKAYANPQAGKIIRHRSKIAEQTLHKVLTELHLKTISSMAKAEELQRIYNAVWPQIDIRDFDYAHQNQRPHLFYIPDLLSKPFFSISELSWIKGVEACFNDIKREVVEHLDIESDGTPYLPDTIPLYGKEWKKIVGKPNWTSIHLYKQGAPKQDIIAKFPVIMDALKLVPLTEINGYPSEIFISVLKPKTRIPPHYGVSNNTLTVHLPLIVPEGCGLRVGGQTFVPEEGKIIAFDDSYDHEAWNNSSQNRVVLIFEVWHPDLSERERKAVSATFEARLAWLANRTVN